MEALWSCSDSLLVLAKLNEVKMQIKWSHKEVWSFTLWVFVLARKFGDMVTHNWGSEMNHIDYHFLLYSPVWDGNYGIIINTIWLMPDYGRWAHVPTPSVTSQWAPLTLTNLHSRLVNIYCLKQSSRWASPLPRYLSQPFLLIDLWSPSVPGLGLWIISITSPSLWCV